MPRMKMLGNGLNMGGLQGAGGFAFIQSLGAEVLTNGDFSAWTGDNPDNWTITGEVGSDPMVTQSGNAARFVSSATSNQPRATQTSKLTSGVIYLVDTTASARASGSFFTGSSDFLQLQVISTAIRKRSIFRVGGTSAILQSSGAAPHDFTVDSLSYKAITKCTPVAAALTNTITLALALPASPVAGHEIRLCYRIAAVGEELLNCWVATIRRNDANSAWNARLDRISAGTVTQMIGDTACATPDALRVVTAGNVHQLWTGASGSYTQRGTDQTNATHNTATGLNVVYDPDFTPLTLTYSP